MKFFSLILLASSLLIVNYSYGSEKESGQLVKRKVSFGDEHDNRSLQEVHCFSKEKEKLGGDISIGKPHVQCLENDNEQEDDCSGPYNETRLSSTLEIKLKSWALACCFSTACMAWMFQEPLLEAYDQYKKTN